MYPHVKVQTFDRFLSKTPLINRTNRAKCLMILLIFKFEWREILKKAYYLKNISLTRETNKPNYRNLGEISPPQSICPI